MPGFLLIREPLEERRGLMFLKRLEIHGFKSFGEKTALEFGRGITAIVGPNGSGKSNIADGIRWVLGEQSARSLRGDTMQDIIFAGSDGKRPLGMASVSLTLGDCQGSLGLDFDEVTVTRRVYRSGESQFLINKAPCRLRDIQDLFLDTGLGREGYSLIGQGQIDRILLARPEERRLIIEEAAGIGKYRARKTEANRRLADTEGKLLRLADIIAELERQLRPLARAASRARQYVQISEEYRAKGQALCAYEWAKLEKDAQQVLTKQRDQEATLEEVGNDLRQEDLAIAALSTEIAELEQRISDLQYRKEASMQEMGEVRRSQALVRERLRHVEAEGMRMLEQDREYILRRQNHRRDLARCLWRLRHLRREWNQELQNIAGLAEVQKEGQRKRQAFLAQLESISTKKEQIRHSIASIQADLQSSIGRQALWEDQSRVLSRRLEEITRQLQKIDAGVAQRTSILHQMQEDWLAKQDKLRSVEELAKQLRTDFSKQEQVVNAHEERLQVEASRLEALSGMEKEYVGYYQGVRAVLRNRHRLPGICGVVAELIETPKELEVAIEIALGGGLQNIVTETDGDARQAVGFLKASNAGRATFLPLDGLRPAAFPRRDVSLLQAKNIVGLASELVKHEAKYNRLVDYLLGRVVITRDLDTAVALGRNLRGYSRIVTLEGDTVSPGGAITGGSLPTGERSGLLQRRQELARLTEAVQTKKDVLVAERRKATAMAEELRNMELEITALTDRLHEQALTIKEQEKQVELGKNEAARWQREQTQIAGEISELKIKVEQEARKKREATLRLDGLTAEEAQWQTQFLAVEEELSVLDQDQIRLQEDFTAYRVGVATRESQIEAMEQEEARYRALLRELADLRRKLEASRKMVEGEEAVLRQDGENLAIELDQLETRLKDIERESSRATRLRMEKKDALAAKESAQKARQEKRETLQMEMAAMERELDRIEIRRARMVETMEDEYEINLESLTSVFVPEGDISELKAEVHSLKNRLRALGSVSIESIDEHQAVQERYSFLKDQQEDLLQAREQLTQVIKEMDAVSQERFRETFRVVQEEFQAIFSRLFGGGTAELVLTPAPEPEAVGLDIVARPPGKRLQNMNLLSGGERALTAISLLFALLRVKPSPFCVLDEIDAALDENNQERFAKLLQDFSRKTQFILITHRPASMEVADTLYGVTMNRANISQLVSVQLDAAVALDSHA